MTGVQTCALPISDDSEKTGPTQSLVAQSAGPPDPVPDVAIPDPQLDAIAGLDPTLAALGGDGGLPTDFLSSISNIQQNIGSLEKSFGATLDSAIGDVLKTIKTLDPKVTSLLSSFGTSVNDIASNLGIPNTSGSATELANNLGLHNASQEDIMKALAEKAGSSQGQARAMLAKMSGEPTRPEPVPQIGRAHV